VGFLCPDSLKTDMTVRLATRRNSRLRSPRLDRLIGKPNGQAAPSLQGSVILRPIRDPIPRLGDVMALFGMVLERQRQSGSGGVNELSNMGASPIGLQPWRVHATKSRKT
jgi:hypothetical protein